MAAPGLTFTLITSGTSLTGTRLKLISQNDAETAPFKEVLVSETVLLQYMQLNMRTERKRIDFGEWASGALVIDSDAYDIKLYDATKNDDIQIYEQGRLLEPTVEYAITITGGGTGASIVLAFGVPTARYSAIIHGTKTF